MIRPKKRTYYLTSERRVLLGLFGVLADVFMFAGLFGHYPAKKSLLAIIIISLIYQFLKVIIREDSEMKNPQFAP